MQSPLESIAAPAPRGFREGLLLAGIAAAVAVCFRAAALSGNVLAVLALGLLAIQAILMMHDCMHGSLFARPWLHRWVGRAIGAYYLGPYHFIRHGHLRHHRRAGLVDDDPEVLHFTEEHARRRPGAKLLSFVAITPVAPLVFAPLLQAILLVEWLRDDRAGLRDVLGDLAASALIWTPIALWLHAHGRLLAGFLLGFAVPYLIGMSIVYLASFPLHTLMAGDKLDDVPATARHFFVTRSFSTGRALGAILCNLNLHLEHHLRPEISRFDLPRFAVEARPMLEKFARLHDLPLALHPTYRGWHRRWWALRPRYNPVRRSAERRAA